MKRDVSLHADVSGHILKESSKIKPVRAGSDHARFHSAACRDVHLSTEQLLTCGGDHRIWLDGTTGRNLYGCAPQPNPHLIALGSSTISTISEGAFRAAHVLHRELLEKAADDPRLYERHLQRLKSELGNLLELSLTAGCEIILSPSGTDAHFITAQLIAGAAQNPVTAITIAGTETGSGVPAALLGRHFSAQTALKRPVTLGESGQSPGLARLVAVPARTPDGATRLADEVEAEVCAAAASAINQGHDVFLTLVDLSKTGLLFPRIEVAEHLAERFGDRLVVLVDGCQFRLSPVTLRSYLAKRFMVAITGSKFIGGPAFCGALFIPQATANRLAIHPPPASLRDYMSRAEWPSTWRGGDQLAEQPNFGLLLRWEAALREMRAFLALDEKSVIAFTQAFAERARDRLDRCPWVELQHSPTIDRRALGGDQRWDDIQTIFPFVLKGRRGYWDIARAKSFHRYLVDQSIQLGQPVPCGERASINVAALRLCLSARLVVQAVKTVEHENHVLDLIDAVVEYIGRAVKEDVGISGAPSIHGEALNLGAAG